MHTHTHTHTNTHAASVVMQRQQQTVDQMHQCYLTAGNTTIINDWVNLYRASLHLF